MSPPDPTDDRVLRRALDRSERASARATLSLLTRELGLLGMAATIARVLAARLRGEPFGALPPPRDRREALGRRQAAPVVQLYRALRARVPEDRAFAITRQAVLDGGVVFLEALIGDLNEEIRSGAAGGGEPEALGARLRALTGRFFNAEGELRLEGAREARFEVRRCLFPGLLESVGEARLAPLFCEVDRAYFVPERTPIRLRRSKTLAAGDPECDFRFRW